MAVAAMKDWLSSKGILPGWVLSGLFHALLVAILLWTMPLWNHPPVGDSDEPTQVIGIFVKEPGKLADPSEAEPTESSTNLDAEATAKFADPLAPQKAMPETSVVEVPLPQVEQLPRIGPGSPLPEGGLPDPHDLIKPSAKGSGKTSNSGGGSGTAFMGVKDEGSRVVYLIDASGSMYEHGAMREAKAALIASLQGLDKTQQFQVIFYNDAPHVMRFKNASKWQLFFATDLNKNLARQFIQSIDPDLGTRHIDALKLGLSFGPEVMYLLTDSGEPRLTASELDEVRRRNGGKTRIHCIEFGVGPDLPAVADGSNFLKKLASQNGGTHRYVDVTHFSKK